MKNKIERINKNLTSVLQMQKQVDKLEKISKEATKENKVRFEVITQLLLLKPDLVSGMSSNRKFLLLIKKMRG